MTRFSVSSRTAIPITPLGPGVFLSVTDGTSTWTQGGGALCPNQVTFQFPGQGAFKVTYRWTDAASETPYRVGVVEPEKINPVGLIMTDFVGTLPYNYKWTLPDGEGRHLRMYYDAMGRPDRMERFNVPGSLSLTTQPFARTHFTYDSHHRVSGITHQDAAGALLFPRPLWTTSTPRVA